MFGSDFYYEDQRHIQAEVFRILLNPKERYGGRSTATIRFLRELADHGKLETFMEKLQAAVNEVGRPGAGRRHSIRSLTVEQMNQLLNDDERILLHRSSGLAEGILGGVSPRDAQGKAVLAYFVHQGTFCDHTFRLWLVNHKIGFRDLRCARFLDHKIRN